MRKPNPYYKRLHTSPTPVRIAVGVLLVLGGLLGFLPVLGFWMIPLGIAVILIDVPLIKRLASRIRRGLRLLIERRSAAKTKGR